MAWKWFTEKWPYYQLKKLLLYEELPGGAAFASTLGSSLMVIFTLQVLTGIAQLFYYVPTTDHAYDSVAYLRTEVPFGWFVHNMHYWGANAMVLVIALHMIRVYVWGAYKTQLTWLIGVALMLCAMVMSFTGAPLIWDEKGYWAGEVGSGITSTVPVLGNIVKTILRGGESMGQLSISRFFVFHVWVFAPVLAFLIAAHIAALRTTGIAGPWDERKRRRVGHFWPDQAARDIIVASVVFFILVTLSVFLPPPFTGQADPLNTSYVPKPEWNFLFVYQALKYFQGPLEPVGTVGVPTVLIVLLVILPFIDKGPERNPLRRPIAMACLFVYACFIIAMTIMGYLSPGFAQMAGAAGAPAARLGKGETGGAKGPAGKGVAAGRKLFQSEGCAGCHKVNGQGGTMGPELSGATLKGKTRKWLADQIRNPKSHNPNSIMPAFSQLSKNQVNALVDYLMGLAGTGGAPGPAAKPQPRAPGAGAQVQPGQANAVSAPGQAQPSQLKVVPPDTVPETPSGKAAYIIGSASNGEQLFKEQCAQCHGAKGAGGVPNPGSAEGVVPPLSPINKNIASPDPKQFARNIDKFIQHGAIPPGPNPALQMPVFGDNNSLTQPEISNIEAYILKLNGVDRSIPAHPGMDPRLFYAVFVIAYVVAAIVLLMMWRNAGRSRT